MNGKRGVPTLSQVAQRAGVSTATVSKVLSNTPYFTEETRQKVMQAVEELGYMPNLAARALSKGRTHIIAVVFPYIYDAAFSDPHTQHILEGIEAECFANGYNLLLSTPRLSEAGPDENYVRLLQSGYLDGIVAMDNVPLTSVIKPALQKHLPAVGIGYTGHEFFIRSDDRQGGALLMQHVLELGHQRIGIIGVSEDLHYSVHERIRGLEQSAQAKGIDFQTLPICEGNFSIQSGAKGAAELLQYDPGITALICLNDRMAMGAIQQARLMGRSVPDDLTVVGYDNIQMAQLFDPALTTIDQHAPELGRAATRMLLALLDGETPPSEIIPTELVVRQSSAPFEQRKGKA